VIFVDRFESIVRSIQDWSEAPRETDQDQHPFEIRNIHPDLPVKVRKLYDDGYTAEAAFEAFKFVEKEVKRIGSIRGMTGMALMMKAFDESGPTLALNPMVEDWQIDEQRGYRHMFAGAQAGIRNPRGHETLVDSPDLCLDHLSIASVLLRKLDEAGLR
jgi:uncharacterized protein (TIGR02391 family)